jgi:hypothetical protein
MPWRRTFGEPDARSLDELSQNVTVVQSTSSRAGRSRRASASMVRKVSAVATSSSAVGARTILSPLPTSDINAPFVTATCSRGMVLPGSVWRKGKGSVQPDGTVAWSRARANGVDDAQLEQRLRAPRARVRMQQERIEVLLSACAQRMSGEQPPS